MSNKKGNTSGPAMNDGFIIRHYAGWVAHQLKATFLHQHEENAAPSLH
jgi:hypothetical protein